MRSETAHTRKLQIINLTISKMITSFMRIGKVHYQKLIQIFLRKFTPTVTVKMGNTFSQNYALSTDREFLRVVGTFIDLRPTINSTPQNSFSLQNNLKIPSCLLASSMRMRK